MKKRLKILGFSFGVAVMVVAIGLLAVCNSQAQMLVHPPRFPIYMSPADYGLNYETLTLTSKDGYHLAAWYIPSRNRAAVIVQHGFPSNRASVLYAAEMLARHGYGVMMVDLRTQGQSEGNKFSFGLYEVNDVEAAYQYLLSRPDIDPQRIGSLGVSMGGVAVLLHAAQNEGIKAVVADSAFAALQDEVETGVSSLMGLPPFPFAPMIQWFAERKVGFDAKKVAPIDHIGAISPRPVFLLQGGADKVIPPDSGQRLYDAAGEPRLLWFEPALGHAEFNIARPKQYEARVVAFFDEYLLKE